MKKGYVECPFCANEIKEGAKKCQYCKEFLVENKERVISDEKFKKRKKVNFVWSVEKLTMNERQLEKNMKIGSIWIKFCSRIMALRFPFSIFIVCVSFLNWQSNTIQNIWMTIVWFLFFLLLISVIYYFIWLIKNYKILIDSDIEWLNHKSYFGLIFCWICPILNFIKPQNTLNDLLNNIANNFWEKFDKNITNEWQRYLNVTLISFILFVFFGSFRYSSIRILWILPFILFLVFNIIQIRTLVKIVWKIVHSQEACLKEIQSI